MFDYLRNLTKSDAEKQQEALNAYLDDEFTSQERHRFEQHLAQNPDLQAQVTQLRGLKQQMRGLPQRRVPRNFMLDPQKYGRPQSAPLIQAYPLLRTATALTAIFFVFALAANLFLSDFGGDMSSESAAPIAMDSLVEITRVMTETVVGEGESVEVTRVVAEEAIIEEEAVADVAAAVEESLELEAPEEMQSEAFGTDIQRESVPAAEMPIDATRMIAGTTEFDEADLEASDALEIPASDEAAEELDESITIPQAAATQAAAQADSNAPDTQADEVVSNREMLNEIVDQSLFVIDPWLAVMLLSGGLLLILLLLTLLARRRL